MMHHFSLTCLCTASISLLCLMLSKKPFISRSITQSFFRQFSRTETQDNFSQQFVPPVSNSDYTKSEDFAVFLEMCLKLINYENLPKNTK